MHKPELKPRHSIFFDYKIYPFSTPPEMEGQDNTYPVVIVGAGLIGLTMALDLARFGIPSVLIEAEAQVSHGSRALALTRRSIEILTQIGVAEPFISNGLRWTHGDSYFRGQKVYEMVMADSPDSSCPPALNLAQQYMEEFLVDACEKTDLIDLRWQSKLVGISQMKDEVCLTIDTPQGPCKLMTEWAIAADGGRSILRELLGLRMEGTAYSGDFVITDIRADIDLPARRQCYFDPEWNPGNNVLIHKQPSSGMWRLDYKLPDGETAKEALEPARIADRVDKILEMIGSPGDWELDWATVYRPNTLTLPNYREGRVLFVGDAAHLLPIFGVRGANTGFQDENNLAWKLAAVLKKQAPASLLDTYSHERVKAAREICEEGGKSTRFMTPQTTGQRLMRDAVLSLSLTENFASDLMHWRTSRPHTYYDSPLNIGSHGEFDGGPPCGEAMYDARLDENGHLLDELTGAGFHLLVFTAGEPDAAIRLLLQQVEKLPVPPIRVLVGCKQTEVANNLTEHVFADDAKHIARRYDAKHGTVYLLRPDLHVCGRWREVDSDAIAAAMNVALMNKKG